MDSPGHPRAGGLGLRIIGRGMTRHKIDPTLIRYIQNAVGAILNIVLVIAILGFFGVETTSLAAPYRRRQRSHWLGAAYCPTLRRVCFLVILQPFKVGDFVVAGGIMGTVKEVGLFVTSIKTLDSIRNIFGNGKIFGDISRPSAPTLIAGLISRPGSTMQLMCIRRSPC